MSESKKMNHYPDVTERILEEWSSKKQDKRSVVIFFVLGTLFLQYLKMLALFFSIMGIIVTVYTSLAQEYEVRYDQDCGQKATCTIEIEITEEMKPPVYFYYKLSNFFQNHRKYTSSRDLEQLTGTMKSVEELSSCEPIITNADAGHTISITNETLNPDDPAIPCGLVANTYFTGSIL